MDESFRLWFSGVAPRLVREWVRRIVHQDFHRKVGRRQQPTRIRPGNFICDAHWAEIEASWSGSDPIDPMGVTIGLACACGLAGRPLEPVRHACCKLNRAGWEGVLDRSRPSWVLKTSTITT